MSTAPRKAGGLEIGREPLNSDCEMSVNKSTIEKLSDLLGPKHVLVDDASCAKYVRDATGEHEGRCMAVVAPASSREVAEILKLANAARTPVVPFGGNTGVSGGAVPSAEGTALILSLERMNRIRQVCPETETAVVEAGVILENLQEAVGRHGFEFPLNLGARGSCMIGGNLSTNAGGSNVLRHGNARALCLGIEVVTPQGKILDLMTNLHKNNSGYSLKDLYIGSEGTLGVITAAILKLFPKTKAYATALVGMNNLDAALSLLNRLQAETGRSVEAFEYMPEGYFSNFRIRYPDRRIPFEKPYPVCILAEVAAASEKDALPDGQGNVPVEKRLIDLLSESIDSGDIEDAHIAANERQRREIWELRDVAFEVSTMRHPLVHNDIALPLNKIKPFIEKMDTVLADIAPGAESITVGHLGDGNLHYNVWLDGCAAPCDDGLRDKVMEAVECEAVGLGGSFSAEHGIGISKLGTMARRKDPVALSVMRAIKSSLDPNNIMNPGKVIPHASEETGADSRI